MKPVSYPETLDFLFHKLPMFSHVGMGAYKKDLGNIIVLCDALGNPQNRFKSIHVAGTNGKGSVSHMLAALLQAAGYKTGLYTSPHLLDFRERIRVNGCLIAKEAVLEFVDRHFDLITSVQPSFFEITVAMAFEWFSVQQVEIAIVEVGLGGRLDSTNIITPELSVITNISYDHQLILGDTLSEIAAEKAGIMKPHIPVIVGETHAETRDVFTALAHERQSPLIFADQHWKITGAERSSGKLVLHASRLEGSPAEHVTCVLDVAGAYQKKNLLTVLAAIDSLRAEGWRVRPDATEALSHVRELTGLRGRWEQLQERPMIIADVAHNEAGITEVMHQVASVSYQALHVVTGFVRDKMIDKILALFPAGAHYYFTQAGIPRALPAAELALQAEVRGLKGDVFPHVNDAFEAAKRAATPDDLILVTGSVFVVAEVLYG